MAALVTEHGKEGRSVGGADTFVRANGRVTQTSFLSRTFGEAMKCRKLPASLQLIVSNDDHPRQVSVGGADTFVRAIEREDIPG